MALTLEQLRNNGKTSLLGRRMGLDNNDFLIGIQGIRYPSVAATSDTTGTAIPNYGYNSVETTTDDTWTLQAPVPNALVELHCATTSTGIRTITPTNATIVTTSGTAGTTISMSGAGASITLFGLTTGSWMQVARSSSALCFASS